MKAAQISGVKAMGKKAKNSIHRKIFEVTQKWNPNKTFQTLVRLKKLGHNEYTALPMALFLTMPQKYDVQHNIGMQNYKKITTNTTNQNKNKKKH